jgi:hypothetical protein
MEENRSEKEPRGDALRTTRWRNFLLTLAKSACRTGKFFHRKVPVESLCRCLDQEAGVNPRREHGGEQAIAPLLEQFHENKDSHAQGPNTVLGRAASQKVADRSAIKRTIRQMSTYRQDSRRQCPSSGPLRGPHKSARGRTAHSRQPTHPPARRGGSGRPCAERLHAVE